MAFAAAIRLREMGSEVGLLPPYRAPIAQKFWPMSELVSSVLVRKLARRGVRGAAAAVAAKAVPSGARAPPSNGARGSFSSARHFRPSRPI